MSSLLLKFSHEGAKKICESAFNALMRAVLNQTGSFSKFQINWFLPTFRFAFTLDPITDAFFYNNSYKFALSWLLKNNANYERNKYISIFPEIISSLSVIFTNSKAELKYTETIDDICAIITQPVFELDDKCYEAASNFLNSAFTTISDMQRVMTLMYTSINVITHSFIDYKKALKQMRALKTTVLSTDAIASEWPKIVRASVGRFVYQNINGEAEKSCALEFACIQKLSSLEEILEPFFKSFSEYTIHDKVYSVRVPHKFLMSIIADKFSNEEQDADDVFYAANKLLQSDMDAKSEWLPIILSSLTKKIESLATLDTLIDVMNNYLIAFPYQTLKYACKLIANITPSKVSSNKWNILLANTTTVAHVLEDASVNNFLSTFIPQISLKFFEKREMRYDFFACKALSRASCTATLLEEMNKMSGSEAANIYQFYVGEFEPDSAKNTAPDLWFDVFFGSLNRRKLTEQGVLILCSFCANMQVPHRIREKVFAEINDCLHEKLFEKIRSILKEENASVFREELAEVLKEHKEVDFIENALDLELEQAKKLVESAIMSSENSGLCLLLRQLKFILLSHPSKFIDVKEVDKLLEDKQTTNIRAGKSIITFAESEDNSLMMIVHNLAGNLAFAIDDNLQKNATVLRRVFAFLIQRGALPQESVYDISFVPKAEVDEMKSADVTPYVDILVYDLRLDSKSLFDSSRRPTKQCYAMLSSIGKPAKHVVNDVEANSKLVETKLLQTFFVTAHSIKYQKTPIFALIFCKRWPMNIDFEHTKATVAFIVRPVDNLYSLSVASAAKLYGIVPVEILVEPYELGNLISLVMHAYFFENDINIFSQRIQLRWSKITAIKNKRNSSIKDLSRGFFL